MVFPYYSVTCGPPPPALPIHLSCLIYLYLLQLFLTHNINSCIYVSIAPDTDQMWMNVPIPEFAQSMRLAATVLEATLVSATQDLNRAVETQTSRAQERPVKVGGRDLLGNKIQVCWQRQQWKGRGQEESGLSSKPSPAKPIITYSFIHAPIQQILPEHLL